MTNIPMLDGPRIAPAEGPARALVVLLHGYGSNGADMIQLAPAWEAALPGAAFVAPDAPQRVPGVAGGYQWWALTSFSPQALAAGVASTAATLDAFLDAELARLALAPDRLVLVGFSQGTMMALHVGLRRAAPACIIGYSGALADAGALAAEVRARPPVLLVHGDADDVVPAVALGHAEGLLRAQGVPVTTRLTPGLGHGVDAAGLADGVGFARAALAGLPPAS